MPLHPQSAAFIAQIAAQNRPGWHEMPPADSRELFSSFKGIFGEGPDLLAVEDQRIANIPVRVYRPSAQSDLPAILYFHGGGWVIGNLDTHDSVCRRLAKESGFVVISVDYRLAPEHKYPAALDDCFAVTEFVAEHGDQLQIDPTRILLVGDSAGGNLCLAVSLRTRDEAGPSIKCQVLIYPVVEPDFETESYQAFATGHGLTRDTMKWFWQQYLHGSTADPTLAHFRTSELHDLPTTHVITAQYDVLRDEGHRLAQRLNAAGVRTTTKCYEGMLHGFVHFGGIFTDGLTAMRDIGQFVQRVA